MEYTSAFAAAERRYRDLLARYQSGRLDGASFQAAQGECVVRDAYGRSWMPAPQPGQWLLWDGQQWALQPYAPFAGPSPVPPVMQQAMSAPQRPIRREKAGPPQAAGQQVIVIRERGRRGFGCGGCLLVALILLLLAGGAGVWLSPLSEKWGLRKPVAERELGPLDREAADEVRFALEDEGVPTEGMRFYVLPYKNGSGRLLYAIADLSLAPAGVLLGGTVPGGDLVGLMVRLAQCKAVGAQQITRIGLEYRNQHGAQVAVLTARTEDLVALAEGRMPRAQLMKALDGQFDLKALTGGLE